MAQCIFARALEDGPSFSAYLVSYRSSELKVYAMVAVPNTPKPKAGRSKKMAALESRWLHRSARAFMKVSNKGHLEQLG